MSNKKTPNKKILGREDILSADDLKKQRINVPEWGGDIYIRVISGIERDLCEKAFEDAENNANAFALIIVFSVCDADGKRLFTEDDVEALVKKNSKALLRVGQETLKLNAMTAESLEELQGN